MIDVLYFSEIDARSKEELRNGIPTPICPISRVLFDGLEQRAPHRDNRSIKLTTRKKRVEGKKIVHSSSKKTRN
jgi:hypothetical protein